MNIADSTEHYTEIDNLASNKRLVLAWLIDFKLYLLAWVIAAEYTSYNPLTLMGVLFIAFLAIRLLAVKTVGTPGYYFLSIDSHSKHVDRHILKHENWLSMLIVIWLILVGTVFPQSLTQSYTAQPFFGVMLSQSIQIIIDVIIVLATLLAGYWFLKLDVKGLAAGIALKIIALGSFLLGMGALVNNKVQEYLSDKSPDEITFLENHLETLSNVFTLVPIAASLIALIAMVLTHKQFKAIKADRQTNVYIE